MSTPDSFDETTTEEESQTAAWAALPPPPPPPPPERRLEVRVTCPRCGAETHYVATGTGENERLRAALERFSTHFEACPQRPCECGAGEIWRDYPGTHGI